MAMMIRRRSSTGWCSSQSQGRYRFRRHGVKGLKIPTSAGYEDILKRLNQRLCLFHFLQPLPMISPNHRTNTATVSEDVDR